MGCRESKAKGWALRCHLELQQHKSAAFITLTYAPKYEPPTLDRKELQLYLKRIRKRFMATNRNVRFFACGEYGEKNGRPHYHIILFSASKADAAIIQAAWKKGHTDVVDAGPGALAYVAGYAAKKYGDESRKRKGEEINHETGEVFTYQPPFLQMSLKPGIGATAKTKFKNSWRSKAILNGQTQAVPRYLHEGWKKTATPMQLEELENEKRELMKTIRLTQQQREAAEQIAITKQAIKADRRKV